MCACVCVRICMWLCALLCAQYSPVLLQLMHQLKHIQATRVDISFMTRDASMFATCSTRCCHKRRRREIQWKHLVITDVVWARSTTGFNATFETLQQLGVIMQDGVNAFDFMRCLASNEQISLAARQHGFDVIVMYGVNFGVFEQTLGTLDFNHQVTLEQYAQSHKLGTQSTEAPFAGTAAPTPGNTSRERA